MHDGYFDFFDLLGDYNKEYGKLSLESDSEDFEYVCEAVVGEVPYKVHDIICILLNIIASFIVFFIIDVELWMIPLIMIAFDMAMIPLNYIFIWLIPIIGIAFRNFGGVIRRLFFVLTPRKLKESLIKKLETKLKTQKEKYDSYGYYDLTANQKREIKREMTKLQTQVSEYKEYMEKTKKEEEEVVDYFSKANLSDIEFIKSILSKIDEEKTKYPKWINSKLDNIIKKSNELMTEVEEDSSSVNLVMKTYNIYLGEMIKAIDQYLDMDEEQQANNKEMIETLMQKFENHIQILKDKVRGFKQNDLNRDVELLMSVLDDYENENKQEDKKNV